MPTDLTKYPQVMGMASMRPFAIPPKDPLAGVFLLKATVHRV